LPTAMRHDGACPNLGRRVALNEVGAMLRGRGAERRPWLGIALEVVSAARHGWRAVLRVFEAYLLHAPAAKRRDGRGGNRTCGLSRVRRALSVPVHRATSPGLLARDSRS
jgi:hypothetical protein